LLYAQNDKNKYSLNLRAGASFPISRFAEKTFSTTPGETSGLARVGFGFDLAINYRIKKSFDALLFLGTSINKQDEKAYENYFKQFYPGTNRVDPKEQMMKGTVILLR